MTTMVSSSTHPSILTLAELRKQLNISRERMSRLIDVSAKTIERWEARGGMPSNQLLRERLVQEIAYLGLMIYTREGFDLFMTTPMGVFDNHTALQMIEHGRGDEVFSAFAADYEGMGFSVTPDRSVRPLRDCPFPRQAFRRPSRLHLLGAARWRLSFR